MFLMSMILVSFHPACVHFSIAMSVSRLCVERPLLSCRCWSSDLLISTFFYRAEKAFNISWANRGYFLDKNEVQIVKIEEKNYIADSSKKSPSRFCINEMTCFLHGSATLM
jgi:hypothetical protein